MKKASLACLFRYCLLTVSLLPCAALRAQQPPQPTDLPGSPFFIKQDWIIGGKGDWDYLTFDAKTNQLFIAHAAAVQVVDVETGLVAGRITGLHDAHAIALDEAGEFGYISDGAVNRVAVFDRRTLQIVASIPTGPSPRAIVIDPQSGLLFAVCTNPYTPAQLAALLNPPHPAGNGNRNKPQGRAPQPVLDREVKASITVIDPTARRRVGEILMPGRLGFAQSDGNGQLFALLVDRNQVARLDASAVSAALHAGSNAPAPSQPPAAASTGEGSSPAAPTTGSPTSGTTSPTPSTADESTLPIVLDWSHGSTAQDGSSDALRLLPLGGNCQQPRGLAVDGAHQRLFAACNNMRLTILNAGSGEVVTSMPIGPETDAVGYDAARGLIYTANGGAQGTLTIIRQDVTDSYAEIQNLATRRRARTLAINQDTGQVYLVTDFVGVDLAQKGGIGALKTTPVDGSFQVLVVGH
jgi:DNA-binding beta-propeller fold protein YncE